jgi:CarD family transcriptional regulator
MSKKTFKKGDFVVYPSHGVGKIASISSQEIGGFSLELYNISFEKEKMTLSVPVSKAEKIGLRPLCSSDAIDEALDIINEAAQTSKGIMWSRRAQEYERKINSGDILSVAEVIRDLHRNVNNPDRSYSERLIYESAYNRFIHEVCCVKKISLEDFEEEFKSMLKIDELSIEDDDFDDDDDSDNDNDKIIAA